MNHSNPLAGDYWGREDKFYKPVYEIREFYKRLYKAVKTVNPEFLMTVHHGQVPVIYAAFFDVVQTGEGLNALFRTAGDKAYRAKTIPADYVPYIPDYSLFDEDYWFSSYRPSGCVSVILAMINKWRDEWAKQSGFTMNGTTKITQSDISAWWETHPDLYRQYTRGMFAHTLILDLTVARMRCDLTVFDTLMNGFEKHFNGLGDPLEQIPYYDSGRFLEQPLSAGMHAVALIRAPEKKAVVILANWGKNARAETLIVKPSALHLAGEKIQKITDLEGVEAPANEGNKLTVTVPPNDYRVLVLE
jgi:hypothetical protein